MTARAVPDGAKAKPRGKPFEKGPDKRRGLGARAPKPFSPTRYLAEYAGMTSAQLADIFAVYARELRKGGDEAPIGALAIVRWLMAMVNDPNARDMALFFQRLDGNTPVSLEIAWKDEARKHGVDPDALVSEFVAAMGARASGGGGVETSTGAGDGADDD